MILKSIKYSQFDNTPQEWKLERFTLGNINLIVGKNSTGKTKALNIIKNLAYMLSGDRKLTYVEGDYSVSLTKGKKKINYILEYHNNKIVKEKLVIDNVTKLSRAAKGEGKIYYEKLQKDVAFQTPQNELACISRMDKIQHPFLVDLYNWGNSLRHYYFGSDLGQNSMLLMTKGGIDDITQEPNPRDPNNVVTFFKKGLKKAGTEFLQSIFEDMKTVGFHIKDIDTAVPKNIKWQPGLPGLTGIAGEPYSLTVRENDLKCITEQRQMSQGMFRCLSLIIQIEYSLLIGKPSCILIDDIGEGLDFERSSALIKLLTNKAEDTFIQLIMATNDRFVMNAMPLKYWSVIQRIGNISRIYNYRNSRELFNRFELTGLNNFDFFSSQYYLGDAGTN